MIVLQMHGNRRRLLGELLVNTYLVVLFSLVIVQIIGQSRPIFTQKTVGWVNLSFQAWTRNRLDST